jgi:hypothetical protein
MRGDGLAVLAEALPAVADLGVEADHLLGQGVLDLADVGESLALAGLAVRDDRQVVEAEHDVLEGTMIGAPFAGCRMLLVLIMSTRASSCASSDSGTCTAIWSPSKSALKAAQTSGWSWIALPSISVGSKAWMPRRCRSEPGSASPGARG